MARALSLAGDVNAEYGDPIMSDEAVQAIESLLIACCNQPGTVAEEGSRPVARQGED